MEINRMCIAYCKSINNSTKECTEIHLDTSCITKYISLNDNHKKLNKSYCQSKRFVEPNCVVIPHFVIICQNNKKIIKNYLHCIIKPYFVIHFCFVNTICNKVAQCKLANFVIICYILSYFESYYKMQKFTHHI